MMTEKSHNIERWAKSENSIIPESDLFSTALKTRVTMASIATYSHPVWRISSNQHSIRGFLPENRDLSYWLF